MKKKGEGILARLRRLKRDAKEARARRAKLVSVKGTIDEVREKIAVLRASGRVDVTGCSFCAKHRPTVEQGAKHCPICGTVVEPRAVAP
jgi:hypothetical protein